MYILNDINQFTIFAAFIDRPKFLETYLIRNAGWFSAQTTQQTNFNSIEEVANSLQLFEQFINRLLNIYHLTNSINIRASVNNFFFDENFFLCYIIKSMLLLKIFKIFCLSLLKFLFY